MNAPPEVLVFGWYVVVGLSGGVWMFRVKPGWVIQMGAGQLNNAPCIFQITSLKNQRLDPPKKWWFGRCVWIPSLGDFQVRFDINFQVPYC